MKLDMRLRKLSFIFLLVSGMSGLMLFNSIINTSNRTEMELSGDIYSIKSASSPIKLWNYTWSGTELDAGYGVDFDSSGNAYVGGFTQNYEKGYRDRDVCAIKFNSSGVVWNYTWGGSEDDEGRDAVVDSEGNIYVTGATQSFGAVEKDVCIVKFNSSGMEWNITWGGIDIEEGKGIAMDTSGNIYVTGDIYSVSNYDRDIFLVKFNPEGIEQWNYSWGGVNYEFGGDVAVDSSGNAYVCGKTQSFGADGYDMCLLNFNSSGLQWNYTWGGGEDDSGYGVAVDSSGNAYVAGITDSIGSGGDDMCLVKFNSLGVEWSHIWGGSGDEAGWDVSLDSSGNIYVAGSTYSFGAGLTDLCLVKFNSYGIVWNYTWGGSDYDMGYGIAIDSSDNAYITGNTANFGASNRDLCLLSIYLDGRPNAPVLYDILPNPDPNGKIELNWSDITAATDYYVYRSASKMTSVDGLIPIAAVSDSNYTDTITTNGIYYYVIVAGNDVVNSTISNRDSVTVAFPSGEISIKIEKQVFTEEEFNITLLLTDYLDQEIENATIKAIWNGSNVPASDIRELGNGLYCLSLTPITVTPGEDPILLNINASAMGYSNELYDIYLAVDPATLDKGTPGDGNGTPGIPGYDAFILIGVICIISVIFVKKQHKKKS